MVCCPQNICILVKIKFKQAKQYLYKSRDTILLTSDLRISHALPTSSSGLPASRSTQMCLRSARPPPWEVKYFADQLVALPLLYVQFRRGVLQKFRRRIEMQSYTISHKVNEYLFILQSRMTIRLNSD
jgi:hypothetical protein